MEDLLAELVVPHQGNRWAKRHRHLSLPLLRLTGNFAVRLAHNLQLNLVFASLHAERSDAGATAVSSAGGRRRRRRQ